MMQAPFQKRRFMVPRWRTLERAFAIGEVQSTQVMRDTGVGLPPSFIKLLERWRIQPSVVTAAELVASALVHGFFGEAVRAAKFLLIEDQSATELVKFQAAEILRRAGHSDEYSDALSVPSPNTWRQRTRLTPTNPLAWVELARIQTVNGNTKSANKSMSVAIGLAPNNRHVLIAASRLFLHEGDAERARQTIARNESSANDPWLIAAEIGLSRVAEKPPRLIKRGISMLNSGDHLPRQLTELAGAIGTDELTYGGRKKAIKHFQNSMRDPTGNSLAQAEWATPHLGIELVPERNLALISDSNEARAIRLFRERQYEQVPDICRAWAMDEPYSVRPYEFGTAVAGLVGDFEKAMSFAKQGLRIKPRWPPFLNSLAFCAARNNNLKEAEDYLRQIKTKDQIHMIISEANRGLISFRYGLFEDGRAQYESAISRFRYLKEGYLSAVASTYFAREALRANLSDAPKLAERALDALKNFPSSPMAYLVEKNRWLAAEVVSDPLPDYPS